MADPGATVAPVLSLARLETPVERLPRLSRELGVDLWIKRDDLTGSGLSGNKVRKLDYLLGEAKDQGCDLVLTTGGIQSNHARATAIAARQLGMEPVLLLRGEAPAVAESNLLLDQLVGAAIHWCSPEEYRTRRNERLAELAAGFRALGRRPYVIPEGGSNGLGSMAYVQAAQEVVPHGPFDAVFVAVGSGGTLAGLALGPHIGPLVGVAVCDDVAYFEARVRAIAAEALAHGAAPLPEPGERTWRVIDRYKGPAYGVSDDATWTDIAWAARTEGLILDPTYSGKAFHALAAMARTGKISGKVLFWHTGGIYGLFGRGAEVPK